MIRGKVSMFAFVQDGKIFLQERGSYSKAGEEWSFFGGHLEEGEDFMLGCKREIKEELNIEIQEKEIEYVGEFKNYIKGVSDYHSHIYISRYYDKYKDTIQVLEGDSGKFFAREEIGKLKMFSHDYMVVENIYKYLQLKNAV